MNNIVDYRHPNSVCWIQAKIIGIIKGQFVLDTESFVLEDGNLTTIVKIPLSKVTNYVLPCGTCVLYDWRKETIQLPNSFVEFWDKKKLVLGKIEMYCQDTNRILVNYETQQTTQNKWFDLNSKHLVYNWEDLR
jgi:hypothetical protein